MQTTADAGAAEVPRPDIDAGADPRVYCEVDGQPASLDGKELSAAGAFVRTDVQGVLDRELDLLARSSAGEIVLRGQVVQVIDAERAAREGRATGFGVLFLDLSDAQRAWLTQTRASLQRPSQPAAAGDEAVAPLSQKPAPQYGAEVLALLQRMREQREELAGLPPYKVLHVEAGCSAADAKAAFFSASKRLHPHMFTRYNCAELEQVVTDLFIAHKRAFDTLVQAANARAPRTPSATRRVAPRPARHSVPPPPSAAPPEDSAIGLRLPKAPTPVPAQPPRAHKPPPPEARSAPKSQRPPPRLPSDRPPTAEAARARAQLMVTDALKDLAGGRLDAAHDRLQQAFEVDSGFVQAELWLMICQARMAKADGRTLHAIARYERVLKLEPNNREALSALRDAQAPEAGAAKRLLGKLFGASKD